jgi:DNA primase
MKFTPEVIQEIKRRIKIVDLIGETVTLERAGAYYKGRCPFPHGGTPDNPIYEDTPSLIVYPDSNSYYCYGCGRGSRDSGSTGSDVISWVRDLKHMSFADACLYLVQKAGIPVEEESPEIKRLKSKTTEKNRVFYKALKKNKECLEYLHSRGINDKMIATWRLGLVTEKHKGAGRIAFPVIDPYGKDTLGFGYRSMDGSEPKYFNDVSNAIYDKGSLLYGLNFAQQPIRDKGFVIVVEGYVDVILLHHYGADNTVGIMGTAFTEKQQNLLRNYTKNIILWLDGDDAGERSIDRHLPSLLEKGFNIKVILTPGKDPDEVATSGGLEAAIKSAFPAIPWFLGRILDGFEYSLYSLKQEVMNKITPILTAISDLNERALAQDIVNRRLGLT